MFWNRIWLMFPIKDDCPVAKIKVVLPKIGPRNGGHVYRWILLIMLPHDDNTISFIRLVLDRG